MNIKKVSLGIMIVAVLTITQQAKANDDASNYLMVFYRIINSLMIENQSLQEELRYLRANRNAESFYNATTTNKLKDVDSIETLKARSSTIKEEEETLTSEPVKQAERVEQKTKEEPKYIEKTYTRTMYQANP